MAERIDLTGMTFGRWTVLGEAPSKNKTRMWYCSCSCGNEKSQNIPVNHRNLVRGGSTKCRYCATKIPDDDFFNYQIGEEIHIKRFNGIILKRYIEIDSRGARNKFYDYQCTNCNGIQYRKSESMIKVGQGCNICYGQEVLEGFNDIPTTDPWMIKFFPG